MNIVHFKSRLAEIVAWCAARTDAADPEESLRTAALRPNNLVLDAQGNMDYLWRTEEEGIQAIRVLAEQRQRLLISEDLSPAPLPQALSSGRLLLCEPNASTWDGLSEDCS